MEKKTLPIVLLIILFFVFSCEKDDAGGNEELPKEEDETSMTSNLTQKGMISSFVVNTKGDFYWRLKYPAKQETPKMKLPSQLSTKEYRQSKLLQGGSMNMKISFS